MVTHTNTCTHKCDRRQEQPGRKLHLQMPKTQKHTSITLGSE